MIDDWKIDLSDLSDPLAGNTFAVSYTEAIRTDSNGSGNASVSIEYPDQEFLNVVVNRTPAPSGLFNPYASAVPAGGVILTFLTLDAIRYTANHQRADYRIRTVPTARQAVSWFTTEEDVPTGDPDEDLDPSSLVNEAEFHALPASALASPQVFSKTGSSAAPKNPNSRGKQSSGLPLTVKLFNKSGGEINSVGHRLLKYAPHPHLRPCPSFGVRVPSPRACRRSLPLRPAGRRSGRSFGRSRLPW